MWKDIKGYRGYYQVSCRGEVRSLDREVKRKGTDVLWRYKGRIIKHGINSKNKYHTVGLTRRGRVRYFYVHRLVALAFIPNLFDLPEVNHKNNDKSNNTVTNLEWVSSKINKRHAVRMGVRFNPRPKCGEDCGAAKLTSNRVKRMRALAATGNYTYVRLSLIFKVSAANVSYIVRGITWKGC